MLVLHLTQIASTRSHLSRCPWLPSAGLRGHGLECARFDASSRA